MAIDFSIFCKKFKRKLIDLLNDDTDDSGEGDSASAGSSKHVKTILYSDSDLQDVSSTLRHSSISDKVFEPLEVEKTSSKVKNKRKKKKRNQKDNSLMAIDFFISFLFFQKVVFKYIKLGITFDYNRDSKKPTGICKTLKKNFFLNSFFLQTLNDFTFHKCSHPSFIKVLAMSIYQQTIVVLMLVQQATFFEKLHSSCFYMMQMSRDNKSAS